MNRLASDVLEFHRMSKLDRVDDPSKLEERRKRLIAEELRELGEAVDAGELESILAETVDVVYVLIGRLLDLGLTPAQIGAAWSLIHAANMDKEPADDPMGKPTKPEGWEPANMADAMEASEPLGRFFISGVGESGFWNTFLEVEPSKIGEAVQEANGTMGAVLCLARLDAEADRVVEASAPEQPDDPPTIANIMAIVEATGADFYAAKRELATWGTVERTIAELSKAV